MERRRTTTDVLGIGRERPLPQGLSQELAQGFESLRQDIHDAIDYTRSSAPAGRIHGREAVIRQPTTEEFRTHQAMTEAAFRAIEQLNHEGATFPDARSAELAIAERAASILREGIVGVRPDTRDRAIGQFESIMNTVQATVSQPAEESARQRIPR